MDPKFSVIIPTYNRVATLGRAICSVVSQSFPAWEIIVVDDGSTDNTGDLVKKYPNVRYCYQVNQGVSSARNRGAEEATGGCLIFLDSDDELLPIALEEFANAVRNSPDSKVILSGFRKVDPISQETKVFPANSKTYSPPLSGTFIIQRDLFQSIGKYDVELEYAENMELFLRLSGMNEFPHVIESMSLIYYESVGGGSKNLQKMDGSLCKILSKHSSKMEEKDLWNLNQTLGVIQLRRGKWDEARKSLLKAIQYRPFKILTYLRLFIACIPPLSMKIYKSNSFSS